MRKHTRIVYLVAAFLAGFIGQLAAFGATTNSVWDLNNINLLSVGKLKAVDTNAATAVFLSDGTFSVLVGTNEFDGTYTNTTKQLTMTLGAGSQAALESNIVDFVLNQIPPGIDITVKSLKVSKIKLSKTGVPGPLTTTMSATASETVQGKTRHKSFSTKSLLTDWVLSSGVAF
jgi:hypothetical protein